MKTLPSFSPAIKKITARLDAMECGYRISVPRRRGGLPTPVSDEFIILEFTMDELELMNVDVNALLDMDELSEFFGADWNSASTIVIFEEK